VTRPSLARRLLASAVAGLCVLLVAGGGALSWAFRRSTEAAFDDRLIALHAALVASLHVEETGRLVAESDLGDPRFERAFSGWYWQVLDERGALLAASRSLWDESLALPETALAAAADPGTPAFAAAGPRGGALRVIVRTLTLPRAESPLRVVLAGDAAELRREIARFDALLLIALGALGAGILVLVGLQMRLALRPLRRFTDELARVRAGELDRVGPGAPRELAPLVDSVNELLAHDAALVARARAQAADLAHALKTPLSLVRAEAEEQGGERGERIARHAETMRRHVELRLAAAVPRSALTRERTPVAAVLTAIRETLARLHPRLAIECRADPGLVFGGAREDLEEIVGNLLENGCMWARSGVRATAAIEADRLVLVFEDDGPGLDPEARRAVLDRGVRLDETAPGSGLGLAIVRDRVELYDGELALDRGGLGGLRVTVRLPATAPAAR